MVIDVWLLGEGSHATATAATENREDLRASLF
jgi:hypothetical protein